MSTLTKIMKMECLLNLPELNAISNPINIQNIQNHQRADCNLMLLRNQHPQQYPVETISGKEIITVRKDGDNNNQWIIACSPSLIPNLVGSYHYTLGHSGTQRLYNTINRQFAAPGLYVACEQFICPDNCR